MSLARLRTVVSRSSLMSTAMSCLPMYSEQLVVRTVVARGHELDRSDAELGQQVGERTRSPVAADITDDDDALAVDSALLSKGVTQGVDVEQGLGDVLALAAARRDHGDRSAALTEGPGRLGRKLAVVVASDDPVEEARQRAHAVGHRLALGEGTRAQIRNQPALGAELLRRRDERLGGAGTRLGEQIHDPIATQLAGSGIPVHHGRDRVDESMSPYRTVVRDPRD